jgi:hypothetical protein
LILASQNGCVFERLMWSVGIIERYVAGLGGVYYTLCKTESANSLLLLYNS